jgi:hypothetical protein
MNGDPKNINDTDKPLNQENIQPQKVDINAIKARVKKLQDKENFRNAIFAVLVLIILASAGIYFLNHL